MTSLPELFIFITMLRFLKVLAVALAIGALIAPGASATACADSHDAECAMDCSCICHCAAFSNGHENVCEAIDPVLQQAVVFEPGCLGILLAADIFRPPTLA